MEREGQLYWQLVLNKVSYGLSWCLIGNESTCNAEDMALIPGSGRFPGEGHRNPLQYSSLHIFPGDSDSKASAYNAGDPGLDFFFLNPILICL